MQVFWFGEIGVKNKIPRLYILKRKKMNMKLYGIIFSLLLAMGAQSFASEKAGNITPISKTPLGMTLITYCREGMFEKFPGAYNPAEFIQTKVEVQDEALQNQLKAIADQCLENINEPLEAAQDKNGSYFFPFKAKAPLYSVALGIVKSFNSPDGQERAVRLIEKGQLDLCAKFSKALSHQDMYSIDKGCRPCLEKGTGTIERVVLNQEQIDSRLATIKRYEDRLASIKARNIK